MKKARIIIADTDSNYIMPLIQKFIEVFFDAIELEIIDNQNYYEKMFANPQSINILIVSEKLYTEALRLQNIDNIFVLSEYLADYRQMNNVTFVYKYTSVRQIFAVITGKCAHVLGMSHEENKKTQILLICSGAGGVGKTTISMGIASCLAKNYKKVLYINASRLQLYQVMLDNTTPITDSDVYVELMDGQGNIYNIIKQVIRNEGFDYVPPFKASLMALGMDYSIYEKIAVAVKQVEDYDYIIIDADNVFDEYETRLIDISDKVIVITKQDTVTVYATNMFVRNINGINKDKYIFVCNDFNEEKTNTLLSGNKTLNFSINEYIGHIENRESMTLNELSEKKDIRKVTFLLL